MMNAVTTSEVLAKVPDFIGSVALISALHDAYVEHIGITEFDGPIGPYIWCACGWRSDDLGPNDNPGESYAVHLTNAQHAAAVKALQQVGVVRRSDVLASGAVIDAATLADDDALVEAGARGFFEGFDKTRRQWPAPEQHVPWWLGRSRDVLRGVAAALSERES